MIKTAKNDLKTLFSHYYFVKSAKKPLVGVDSKVPKNGQKWPKKCQKCPKIAKNS
jgi:hypothetical protein